MKMKHWGKDNCQENTEMFGDKLHMCHFNYFSHKSVEFKSTSRGTDEWPPSMYRRYIPPNNQLTIQPTNQVTNKKQTSSRGKNTSKKFRIANMNAYLLARF
jgi:hypothetical protein